ncbi:hypothetical protein LCGC14_3047070, partial [marine sediment metagenome]
MIYTSPYPTISDLRSGQGLGQPDLITLFDQSVFERR